nr:MAG TPA: hypothetical protein [Caudoviricetes sp.]
MITIHTIEKYRFIYICICTRVYLWCVLRIKLFLIIAYIIDEKRYI